MTLFMMINILDPFWSDKQLGSVWSPRYTNTQKKERDIMQINQLNKYKNGNCLMFKTISYLTDRARLSNIFWI